MDKIKEELEAMISLCDKVSADDELSAFWLSILVGIRDEMRERSDEHGGGQRCATCGL